MSVTLQGVSCMEKSGWPAFFLCQFISPVYRIVVGNGRQA